MTAVGSLEIYYIFEHDESPIILENVAEISSLIDRVSIESPPRSPILMNVFTVKDPDSQVLEVGVSGDRGLVRYAGREWPRGVVSVNPESTADGEVPYFYMGHWQPYPANSEIPLDQVRNAMTEFMTSDGARPGCIHWQPGLL